MKTRSNPERDSAYGYHPDPEEPSLVEPEWADSCDINKMIHQAMRGAQVRGGAQPIYGYDDTTLDAVTLRIEKQKLESSLHETASTHAFTEEELKHIHPDVQKKFNFKKADSKSGSNDDSTTKNAAKPPKQNYNSKEKTKSSGNVPKDSSEPNESDSDS